MRDYAKVSPQFWIGSTGKRIRAAGIEAQVVAMYLVSSPHANMLGLYYLPIPYICHETGLSPEGASKALASLSEAEFCRYDAAAEVVWVVEMAKYQVADGLKPDDKRCKGIQNDYEALPENAFLSAFYERYRHAFHMATARGQKPAKAKAHRSPFQAPPKPGAGAGAGAGENTLSGEPDGAPASPPPAQQVLDYLNERAGTDFRAVETNLKLVNARLASGVSVEQCRQVIDAKVAEWGSNPDMAKFLRPKTLFAAANLEQYVGALGAVRRGAERKGLPTTPDYVLAGFGSAEEMARAQVTA